MFEPPQEFCGTPAAPRWVVPKSPRMDVSRAWATRTDASSSSPSFLAGRLGEFSDEFVCHGVFSGTKGQESFPLKVKAESV